MSTTAKIEQLRDDNGKFPAYAWPGGYPIIYVMEDSDVLCPPCVNGENGSEVGSPDVDGDPQWTVAVCDCYWEGPVLYCGHCGGEIESAYGDPDEETESE